MSPELDATLLLWRAYDAAVVEARRVNDIATAAMMTWHPPRSKRRQLPPEVWTSIAATLRADAARTAAEAAFYALGLVFDESPNEAAAEAVPCDPPRPVAVGTRPPVRFRTTAGGTAWHSTPPDCYGTDPTGESSVPPEGRPR